MVSMRLEISSIDNPDVLGIEVIRFVPYLWLYPILPVETFDKIMGRSIVSMNRDRPQLSGKIVLFHP